MREPYEEETQDTAFYIEVCWVVREVNLHTALPQHDPVSLLGGVLREWVDAYKLFKHNRVWAVFTLVEGTYTLSG